MSLSRRSLMTAVAVSSNMTAAAVLPLVALNKSLVYRNAANIVPCGKAALAEYLKQLADFQQNSSFQNREIYKPLSESVRAKLAALLHAAPDEIALTRNPSESNNLIAPDLRLKPGDEILITAHNHPSNTQSWQLRAQPAGATVVVDVPISAKSADELLATLQAEGHPQNPRHRRLPPHQHHRPPLPHRRPRRPRTPSQRLVPRRRRPNLRREEPPPSEFKN